MSVGQSIASGWRRKRKTQAIRCDLELAGGITAPPIAHELPRHNMPDTLAAIREAVAEQLKKRSAEQR
jgi:hypothetical protein